MPRVVRWVASAARIQVDSKASAVNDSTVNSSWAEISSSAGIGSQDKLTGRFRLIRPLRISRPSAHSLGLASLEPVVS
jgi:hypothetical protein